MPIQALPEFRVPVVQDFHGPEIPDFVGLMQRNRAAALSEQEKQQLMELRKQVMAKNAQEMENESVLNAMKLADAAIVPKLSITPQGAVTAGTTPAGAFGEGSPEAPRAIPLTFLPNGQVYDASAKLSQSQQVENAKLEREKELLKAKPSRKQVVGVDTVTQRPITFDPDSGGYEVGELPPGVTLGAKPSSKSGSGRGLTPNAQTSLFSSAGAVGINADDPAYYNPETKEYDVARLAIDVGKAKRTAKIEENRAKQAGKDNALSGEQKTYLGKLDASEMQLDSLKSEIERLAENEPGFMDSVIATATAAPADGMFSALANKSLKYFQSDDSKKLEARKGIIQSALTQAISGMAVSDGEARRLGFLPRPEDSFHDLLIKTGILEDYIKNQRNGVLGGPSRGGNMPTPEQNSTNAPSGEQPDQSTSNVLGLKSTPSGATYRRIK